MVSNDADIESAKNIQTSKRLNIAKNVALFCHTNVKSQRQYV